MTFVETELAGAFIIELQPHLDERGFFARAWCAREFEAHGLQARMKGEPVREPEPRHGARASLSAGAFRGSQARAMHPRRDLRRDRGFRPESVHASEVDRRGADGRQPSDVVRAGGVRPRVPVAGGRYRGVLSGFTVLHARGRAWDPLGRSGAGNHLARCGAPIRVRKGSRLARPVAAREAV